MSKLNIGEARAALMMGKKVRRTVWNKEMYLKSKRAMPINYLLEECTEKEATGYSEPVILLHKPAPSEYLGKEHSDFMPYIFQQSDIIREDWEIIIDQEAE